MPGFADEESYMDALDSGLLAETHMKYSELHRGPILDLTHLAEEPAPENDTNDSDLPAADLLRA